MTRGFLDQAPVIALLGVWALAGLGGALDIARATDDLRYLALGGVTVPSLVLIATAMRRAYRSRPQSIDLR